VGRSCKPALMEVCERRHVSVRRRRTGVAIGRHPLSRAGPRAKEASADEALQA
jgi:hypothetical protein